MKSEEYNVQFRSAAVKLLNKSMICKDFTGDDNDYEFIKDHYEDFSEYFERIGCKILHHRAERTIRLIEEDDHKLRKESSSKAEIAVFIILRETYIQRIGSLELLIPIRRREILDAMPACFNSRNFSPTKYIDVMRKLRRHDLVNWKPGTDLTDLDSIITIYPSILFAQDDKAVETFFKSLKENIEEEDEDNHDE